MLILIFVGYYEIPQIYLQNQDINTASTIPSNQLNFNNDITIQKNKDNSSLSYGKTQSNAKRKTNNSRNTFDRFLTLLFTIPDKGSMQGLAYAEGNFYIGFAKGFGMGQIDVINLKGKLIKKTGLLPIQHAGELAFRKTDRLIYVSNGNVDKPAKIFAVNMNSTDPSVVHTIVPDIQGYGALIAIDNNIDQMIISTNSSILSLASNPISNNFTTVSFYTCDFDGKVFNKFTIPYQGIPQGVECYKSLIYFYTNNKLTVLNKNGKILKIYALMRRGESEGMTLAIINNKPVLTVGYNYPGRVYVLKIDLAVSLPTVLLKILAGIT